MRIVSPLRGRGVSDWGIAFSLHFLLHALLATVVGTRFRMVGMPPTLLHSIPPAWAENAFGPTGY